MKNFLAFTLVLHSLFATNLAQAGMTFAKMYLSHFEPITLQDFQDALHKPYTPENPYPVTAAFQLIIENQHPDQELVEYLLQNHTILRRELLNESVELIASKLLGFRKIHRSSDANHLLASVFTYDRLIYESRNTINTVATSAVQSSVRGAAQAADAIAEISQLYRQSPIFDAHFAADLSLDFAFANGPHHYQYVEYLDSRREAHFYSIRSIIINSLEALESNFTEELGKKAYLLSELYVLALINQDKEPLKENSYYTMLRTLPNHLDYKTVYIIFANELWRNENRKNNPYIQRMQLIFGCTNNHKNIFALCSAAEIKRLRKSVAPIGKLPNELFRMTGSLVLY